MSDDVPQMSKEEAGEKGQFIQDRVVDIWSAVEWSEDSEVGDPYIKITLYKSGRFTVEDYDSDEISEFTLNNEIETIE